VVGEEFKREETGKLENLSFFLHEKGREKAVFHSSPRICTALVNGRGLHADLVVKLCGSRGKQKSNTAAHSRRISCSVLEPGEELF
jgi:hypothetical protein